MTMHLRQSTVILVGLLAFSVAVAEAGGRLKVGTGAAASCTEAALQNTLAIAASQGGGRVSFRCGAAPVRIQLTETLSLPDDTAIDGGGLITLGASLLTPGFVVVAADTRVVLTNLTVSGGDTTIRNEGMLTIHNSVVTGGRHNIRSSGHLTVTHSTISHAEGDFRSGGIGNGVSSSSRIAPLWETPAAPSPTAARR
jgi:hypothetical protein